MAHGNCFDSYNTLKLFEVFKDKLIKLDLYHYYSNLISPLIPVLAEIELQGMMVDEQRLDHAMPLVEESVKKAKEKLYTYPQVKPEDNLASIADLVNILFIREDGFGLYPPFRTKKKGDPQVDKNTLETLESLIEEELEKRK